MIDKSIFEIDDINKLNNNELDELYIELNKFNNYIYNFVISYHKYIFKPKNYGTEMTLSMIDAHMVSDIYESPGITANILATKWDKTPAFISQRLKVLEEDGLIYRKLNKENRKFYNLFLTEKGEEFNNKHKKYDIESILKTNKELMKKYSLEDLVKLRNIMTDYIEIISNEKD